MVTANLGNVELDAAVLDPDISARGFVLTCSATVAGPGVELILGVGDKMYDVGVLFWTYSSTLATEHHMDTVEASCNGVCVVTSQDANTFCRVSSLMQPRRFAVHNMCRCEPCKRMAIRSREWWSIVLDPTFHDRDDTL